MAGPLAVRNLLSGMADGLVRRWNHKPASDHFRKVPPVEALTMPHFPVIPISTGTGPDANFRIADYSEAPL